MLNFRQATKEDAASVARLMMLAMDKIVYDFIGENNYEKGVSLLENLFRENYPQLDQETGLIISKKEEIEENPFKEYKA